MNGSRQLFECVPNFSEGRDSDLIRELATGAAACGVYVADVTSDADHHRSVMTWFGTEAAVLGAASHCLAVLEGHYRHRGSLFSEHRGVHPRTGLLDVLPFIPLSALGAPSLAATSSSMPDAVAAARSVGKALGARHGTPIYFYEQAATSPARSNLAHHRRVLLSPDSNPRPAGQRTDGSAQGWPPDAGPSTPHPVCGSVMVSARRPLIAFNLDLETTDVRLARRIAHRIRATTEGGLEGVKALGLTLRRRACAQVSVNLVDARVTQLPALLARVMHEAAAESTQVRSCELIGLVTDQALAGATASDLLLPDLDQRRLVSYHLQQASDHADAGSRGDSRGDTEGQHQDTSS